MSKAREFLTEFSEEKSEFKKGDKVIVTRRLRSGQTREPYNGTISSDKTRTGIVHAGSVEYLVKPDGSKSEEWVQDWMIKKSK